MDEPSYIKDLKLKILSQIATENNLGDILNELGEYFTDINRVLFILYNFKYSYPLNKIYLK